MKYEKGFKGKNKHRTHLKNQRKREKSLNHLQQAINPKNKNVIYYSLKIKNKSYSSPPKTASDCPSASASANPPAAPPSPCSQWSCWKTDSVCAETACTSPSGEPLGSLWTRAAWSRPPRMTRPAPAFPSFPAGTKALQRHFLVENRETPFLSENNEKAEINVKNSKTN